MKITNIYMGYIYFEIFNYTVIYYIDNFSFKTMMENMIGFCINLYNSILDMCYLLRIVCFFYIYIFHRRVTMHDHGQAHSKRDS